MQAVTTIGLAISERTCRMNISNHAGGSSGCTPPASFGTNAGTLKSCVINASDPLTNGSSCQLRAEHRFRADGIRFVVQ